MGIICRGVEFILVTLSTGLILLQGEVTLVLRLDRRVGISTVIGMALRAGDALLPVYRIMKGIRIDRGVHELPRRKGNCLPRLSMAG